MFYIYLWLREDGTPYYVGKGTGNRAYINHGHSVICPKDKSRIIIYPVESEYEAFENEVALIWYYGRKVLGTGCLRNITEGGDAPPSRKGKKASEEHRRKLREAWKVRVVTDETRRKISESLKGNKRSKGCTLGRAVTEETRRKISISLKGRTLTEEIKRKISNGMLRKVNA